MTGTEKHFKKHLMSIVTDGCEN